MKRLPTKKRKSLQVAVVLFKAAVLLGTGIFLYIRVFQDDHWDQVAEMWSTSLAQPSAWIPLLLTILLVPVNWGIEAYKWQNLMLGLERLSPFRAFKAIWAGVNVSVFTPNRTGEFAGRLLFVHPRNRWKSILPSVLCSFAQLVVTVTLGCVALLFYVNRYWQDTVPAYVQTILIFALLLLSVLLVVLYIYARLINRILQRFPRLWKRIRTFFRLLFLLKPVQLARILGWSTLRYTVYCTQFFLLLYFFQTGITLSDALVLIPLNYLAITAIPSIALAELGIREGVALVFLGMASTHNTGIVAATFVLWLMNIALPALVGSVFVQQARLLNGKP
ncbi:MAG: flippase-like domain-containing protein [Leptolyngbya sp. SIO3F4]|nr:flippase-like domain-containing protein [Leptolyngbya sp. SIO3F4]